MVSEVSFSAINYFMPIFSFLLVFIVIFALLKKTGILGENSAVSLFISFLVSSFFIMEASLVEFVQFNSAWFAVGSVSLFFLVTLIAFLPWKEPFKFMTRGNWFSWAFLGIISAFFVVSSAYVFNWVIDWGTFQYWFNTDWFGMLLLLLIAGVVSWKIGN
jgi:hypothetical protein